MPAPSNQPHTTRFLLTAAEAFPALEGLFLDARVGITLGFRVFDPLTHLVSDRARAVGDTWFDLVVNTLERGVSLNFVLSDFDAFIRPDYHQRATRCRRILIAAGEIAGRPDLLAVRTAAHPARVGAIPSLALWPSAYKNLSRTVAQMNALPPASRARRFSELPDLHPFLRVPDKGAITIQPLRMPRLAPVTHHQKIVSADDDTLYIGGLDLNDRRFDTVDHKRAAEETWHDVQVLCHGPIAREARLHIEQLTDVVAGRQLPQPAGQLLRTLSRRRRFDAFSMSPLPIVAELDQAHATAVRTARQLIYMETQFFRDIGLARQLVQAARANTDLSLILIVPAAPEDVAFDGADGSDARYGEYMQAKCVDLIRTEFGTRLFIGAPAQCRSAAPDEGAARGTLYGAPLIYLHAKVAIFDTTSAIVSSANLNGRSLHWDTEAGLEIREPGDVAAFLQRCCAHWLHTDDVPPAFTDPSGAVAAWRTRAQDNARVQPENRQGFILPYAARPARRFGRNLPGIPQEMV